MDSYRQFESYRTLQAAIAEAMPQSGLSPPLLALIAHYTFDLRELIKELYDNDVKPIEQYIRLVWWRERHRAGYHVHETPAEVEAKRIVAEKRSAGANIARICFTLLYSNEPNDVAFALDLLNADQRKNLYHLWRELTIEFKPPADAVSEAKAMSLPCEVLPYYFDHPHIVDNSRDPASRRYPYNLFVTLEKFKQAVNPDYQLAEQKAGFPAEFLDPWPGPFPHLIRVLRIKHCLYHDSYNEEENGKHRLGAFILIKRSSVHLNLYSCPIRYHGFTPSPYVLFINEELKLQPRVNLQRTQLQFDPKVFRRCDFSGAELAGAEIHIKFENEEAFVRWCEKLNRRIVDQFKKATFTFEFNAFNTSLLHEPRLGGSFFGALPWLLQLNFSINFQDNGHHSLPPSTSLLFIAANQGNFALLDRILAANADPTVLNYRFKFFDYVLMRAIKGYPNDYSMDELVKWREYYDAYADENCRSVAEDILDTCNVGYYKTPFDLDPKVFTAIAVLSGVVAIAMTANMVKTAYDAYQLSQSLIFPDPIAMGGVAVCAAICIAAAFYVHKLEQQPQKLIRETLVSKVGVFKQGNKVQLPVLVDQSRARPNRSLE